MPDPDLTGAAAALMAQCIDKMQSTKGPTQAGWAIAAAIVLLARSTQAETPQPDRQETERKLEQVRSEVGHLERIVRILDGD